MRKSKVDDETLCRFGVLPFLKKIKVGANGQLFALCPFHDDRRQSFSVNRQTGLWKCFAGCGDGNAVQFYARAKGITEAEAVQELVEMVEGGNGSNNRRIVAVYSYHDEAGKLLFQVVRYEPKEFRVRRPGAEGWIWNLAGVERVLYRLPELLASDQSTTIFVVEGEKDCDRLHSLNLIATTNPGGAGKWREEYNAALAGKQVVILPDNDSAGETHAVDVARALLPVAAAVKIVRLPGLPPVREKHGEDISDWLDQGHTVDELIEVVKATPPLRPEDLPTAAAGLSLTRLKDLLAEPEEQVSWLVDGLLPTGGFSLLAGKPKTGKSTLARHLTLCVSRGEPFLGRCTQKGPAIYLALEEKRDEIRRHFADMGATGDEEIFIYASTAPANAVSEIWQIAEKMKPGLIVVDTLFRLTRIQDANAYAEVMLALEPLLALARQTGAHLLCVHHLGKAERTDGDAILGSTAFFATVDVALLLKRNDRYRTLRTIQRYGTDLEETVLRFDPEARTVSLGSPKAEEEENRIAGAIIEFLTVQEEPVTEAEIDENVEGRRSVRKRALRRLVTEGRVERTGRGGRGSPYLYSLKNFGFSGSQHIPGNQGTRIEKSESTPSCGETYSGSQNSSLFFGFWQNRGNQNFGRKWRDHSWASAFRKLRLYRVHPHSRYKL